MSNRLTFHDMKWGRALRSTYVAAATIRVVELTAPYVDPNPIVLTLTITQRFGDGVIMRREQRFSRHQLRTARKEYNKIVSRWCGPDSADPETPFE